MSSGFVDNDFTKSAYTADSIPELRGGTPIISQHDSINSKTASCCGLQKNDDEEEIDEDDDDSSTTPSSSLFAISSDATADLANCGTTDMRTEAARI